MPLNNVVEESLSTAGEEFYVIETCFGSHALLG
jgi:hypothetical protein